MPRGLNLYNFRIFRQNTYSYFKQNLIKHGFKSRQIIKFKANLSILFNFFNIYQPGSVFNVSFNQIETIFHIFNQTSFFFFPFFEKLNKKLYKYANYKRSRYLIRLTYLPPYRRMKSLLKGVLRSVIYESGNTYKLRFKLFILKLYLDRDSLFFYKYLKYIQVFLFKKKLNKFIYSQ